MRSSFRSNRSHDPPEEDGLGGPPPTLQTLQRLLTGALIAVMSVVAVALTLALRGITTMDSDFVLRLLAAAAVVGAAAGGWIAGHRPWLAGGLVGAAATGGFWIMVLRTARACRLLDLGVQAAALVEPLVWLVPLVAALTVVAAWGAARGRTALS